jgi:VanZ family protein
MAVPPDNPPPDSGAPRDPAAEGGLDFDPYRFGAPEQPVPPEYAPPGYRPPEPAYPPPGHRPPAPQGGYGPPAYQPGPPPPQPYAVPYYAHARRGTGKAIASLVLGIASIILSILSVFDVIFIALAVIFGVLGLTEANRSPHREGRGMSIAGLVCAGVGAVLAVVLTVWFVGAATHCTQYDSGSTQFQNCFRDHL